MALRNAVLLVSVGAILLVGGVVLAVTFHGYTLFSLPVTSSRDVVASAAIAAIGLLILVFGTEALLGRHTEPGP